MLSIGNGPESRIYKTTDAGATWTLQFTNDDPKAFFDAMAFWDADHGIAVSDSVDGAFVIITTDNGGRTWTRVPADRLPAALPNEGAFAASGTNVTVVGRDHVWFGTGAATRARVLRSADRGRTWQIAETPLAAGQTSGIYSIAFRDAPHGVVVGGDYSKEPEAVDNVAVTDDGGATWNPSRGGDSPGSDPSSRHVPGRAPGRSSRLDRAAPMCRRRRQDLDAGRRPGLSHVRVRAGTARRAGALADEGRPDD